MPLVNFQEAKDLQFLVNSWSKDLNPLLASPIAAPTILKDISLITGQANAINHLLGEKLTGYLVILNSAQSTIWDNQSTNPLPDKTLILRCSANTTVSLLVF